MSARALMLLLVAAVPVRAGDAGRELYAEQACWQCHVHAEDTGFPEIAGTRRTGPVLGGPGLLRSREWQLAHLWEPRAVSPESQMPSYRALFREDPRAAAVTAFVRRYDSRDGSEREDGIVTQEEYEDAGGEAWADELARLDTGNGVISLADGAPRPTPGLEALLAFVDPGGPGAAPPAAAPIPPAQPGDAARGRRLFLRHCAGCHGARADGNGPAARFFGDHPPRNFLRGEYKFRSTVDPAPLDEDLYRTIRRGAGPSMPAWPFLADAQVWDLVAYLKSLHYGFLTQELFVRDAAGDVVLAFVQEGGEVDGGAAAPLGEGFVRRGPDGGWTWVRGDVRAPIADGARIDGYTFTFGRVVNDWTEDYRPRPLAIPPEPFPYSAASAEIGQKVYLEFSCANCHGPEGRGDGQAAATTRGSLGEVLRPTDYTRGARWLKGGADARSLVRSFLTGLHGTPMPAYASNFAAATSAPPAAAPWHLAHFVMRQAGVRFPE